MTERSLEITRYNCDMCGTSLIELKNLNSKTSFMLEFICGRCGKKHTYGHGSSETPNE